MNLRGTMRAGHTRTHLVQKEMNLAVRPSMAAGLAIDGRPLDAGGLTRATPRPPA